MDAGLPGTAIGPYLSILQLGKDLDRFKNLVWFAARYAADLSYLPLMQELEKRYEGENCAFRRWSVRKRQRGRSPGGCRR